MKPKNHTAGFTLVELMVAITILALIMAFAAATYTNYFNASRNVRAANLVYEEARFATERIAKEIRVNTVDYEEYFNQSKNDTGGGTAPYAKNYCEYSQVFYDPGIDEIYGTSDDVSRGENQSGPAISGEKQNALFLISEQGDRRTYVKRMERDGVGRIGLLKLAGKDYGIDHAPSGADCPPDVGEHDGRIDTWVCEAGFDCAPEDAEGPCASVEPALSDARFIDITPKALDVKTLTFAVTPSDDPRKGYRMSEIQRQPAVTIELSVSANPALTREFRGGSRAALSLSTTVSSRVQNEVVTECNLQECVAGSPPRLCPKQLGVCQGAVQICQQSIWPGCGTTEYQAAAGSAAYENGSEYASCDAALAQCQEDCETDQTCVTACATEAAGCRQNRCSDKADNNCDGLPDEADPACILDICNNGRPDPGETCEDVGGLCQFLHPQTPSENSDALCGDGLDNDCDGRADQNDDECQNFLCQNGLQDTGEICVDVGGPCESIHPNKKENTATLCSDGVDNDCNGFADEMDTSESGCQTAICTNGKGDYDLVDQQTIEKNGLKTNWLLNYADALDLSQTSSDEYRDIANKIDCVDIGGLCEDFKTFENRSTSTGQIRNFTLNHIRGAEDSLDACTDKLDNDCNGLTDEEDKNCCPDDDGDGFKAFLPKFPPESFVVCAQIPGRIDCNDEVAAIGPRSPLGFDPQNPPAEPVEICGNGVDDNCSSVNRWTSTDKDENDPACCIDRDGDGWGDASAYQYSSSASPFCANSAARHVVNRSNPGTFPTGEVVDCNDSDPSANPGTPETSALCNDGKDNDCDGLLDAEDPDCS